MDVLKAIFDSVFNIVTSCFNAIDIDLFGVGFTILDYFIAVLLLGLVIRFLGKSLSISDSFNMLSLDLKNLPSISNDKRKNSIVSKIYTDEGIRSSIRIKETSSDGSMTNVFGVDNFYRYLDSSDE